MEYLYKHHDYDCQEKSHKCYPALRSYLYITCTQSQLPDYHIHMTVVSFQPLGCRYNNDSDKKRICSQTDALENVNGRLSNIITHDSSYITPQHVISLANIYSIHLSHQFQTDQTDYFSAFRSNINFYSVSRSKISGISTPDRHSSFFPPASQSTAQYLYCVRATT